MARETVWIVAGATPEQWPLLSQTEADVYIGVDRGAWHLKERGVRVDVAVGDFDSLSKLEREELRLSVPEMLELPAEKDDTDTQIGLLEGFQRFPEAAEYRLIGATGGRLDHFLANLWLPLEARFRPLLHRLRLVDRQNDVQYFTPGEYVVEAIAGKKYVAFVALVAVQKLTLKNVKYTLPPTDFAQPISLASNEFLPQQAAQFAFKEGIIAVIQSADA